jgi:uncharacterized membrane protein (DUF485 family)
MKLKGNYFWLFTLQLVSGIIMQLIHKTDSFQSILLVVAMAIIYFYFPLINWFFAMYAGLSIFRGITGLIIFATN